MAGDDRFLAEPGERSRRGVLVLHAWWGLNEFIRTLCRRLSDEGLVVLAPDLYHGMTAVSVDAAKRLRSRLKREAVEGEVRQAAKHLRTLCGGGEGTIGTLGFSLGGHWALWLAGAAEVPVAATVVFYASRGGDYSASQSAFQFHLAETDSYVAASGVRRLEKALRAAGCEAEFYTYRGTTHWFFEKDRREAFNAKAARVAWTRTLAFLGRHLA